jgi:hypothetical protein
MWFISMIIASTLFLIASVFDPLGRDLNKLYVIVMSIPGSNKQVVQAKGLQGG